MGAVYEAVQLDLERAVAVKLVTERSVDAKSIGRLRQEAIATARLEHPNVVAVLDLGVDEDGLPFIVMEHVIGASLREVIAKERRLGVERAVRIAREMLGALSAAHAAGIVHRDVKPANVMVTDDDRVKLVDFGIARLADHERAVRTTTGTLLGTPAYLAPEQLVSVDVDGRADLHAVGLCLFEMLLGARPFRGSPSDLARAVLNEVPPRLDSRREDVPQAVADVVARALAKRPEDRYPSATEMSAALEAAVRRAPPASVARRSMRRPLLAVAVAVAVAAAGGVAAIAAGVVVATRPTPPAAVVDASPPQTVAPAVVAVSADAESGDDADAAIAADDTAEDAGALPEAQSATASAKPLVWVGCALPGERFGHLCGVPHPSCECTTSSLGPGVYACPVPWEGNRCPLRDASLPRDSKNGDPCATYLWRVSGGGVVTSPGTGRVYCQYCSLYEWRNERRRGIPGAPCTGVNPTGQTKSGIFQPLFP